MNQQTIVVADDESHILNVVSLKLRNAGYRVLTASDGAEALDLVVNEKPDLLITDFHMPVMSGIELCRAVRSNPAVAGTKAIMLSARGYNLEQADMEASGVLRMLSKPFSPRQLLQSVQEVLEGSGGGELKVDYAVTIGTHQH